MKTATLSRTLPTRPGAAWCEVLSGQGVAQRALLPETSVICGSESSADIVISESTVSRKHARFEATARGVRVEDLGSRNGTWYLGASVSEAMVPYGATVRLGKALVRFVAGDVRTLPPIEGLDGASAAITELRAQLHRVASTDVPVLLRGETGAGKETAARALHGLSPRAAAPFVVFEGGFVSTELLESHLFGHKRGAFTGASDHRVGAIEQAHRGTLFLDEVGELTAEAQVRLLRVLERRTFTRVGDGVERTSDFRLVSATQHDLEQLVREKRFREDLFFRLAVVVIDVPPLRRREADVMGLAERFAAERGVTLDGATLAAWKAREWPGNVRELKNAVERYAAELDTSPKAPRPKVERAQVMGELDRSLATEALEAHGWDVGAAAAQLGLSRSQLYRVMQRHGIAPRKRAPTPKR
ncbi:MAG: sigma 54-interacting transcriptional regulator [Archangium sp.]